EHAFRLTGCRRSAADVTGRERLGVTQYRGPERCFSDGLHVVPRDVCPRLQSALRPAADHRRSPHRAASDPGQWYVYGSTDVDQSGRRLPQYLDDRNVRRHVPRPVRGLGTADGEIEPRSRWLQRAASWLRSSFSTMRTGRRPDSSLSPTNCALPDTSFMLRISTTVRRSPT